MQELICIISEVKHLNSNTKEIRLLPTPGKALPHWSPGAQIDIYIEPDDSPSYVSSYSLTGTDCSRHEYRVVIERKGRWEIKGNHLYESAFVGQAIAVKEIRSSFQLKECKKRILLLGAGVGISPLMSMAHALDRQKKFYEFHYITSSLKEALFSEEISRLSFGKTIYYSPENSNATPDLAPLIGTHANGDELYISGESPLINATLRACIRNNWPIDSVTYNIIDDYKCHF
jgi:vanillate O-demethylase ferredoxin subunit